MSDFVHTQAHVGMESDSRGWSTSDCIVCSHYQSRNQSNIIPPLLILICQDMMKLIIFQTLGIGGIVLMLL